MYTHIQHRHTHKTIGPYLKLSQCSARECCLPAKLLLQLHELRTQVRQVTARRLHATGDATALVREVLLRKPPLLERLRVVYRRQELRGVDTLLSTA